MSAIINKSYILKFVIIDYSNYNADGKCDAKYVKTTALCNKGDSGGLVYQPINSSGLVLGIVHEKVCKSLSCKEPGNMLFSRLI